MKTTPEENNEDIFPADNEPVSPAEGFYPDEENPDSESTYQSVDSKSGRGRRGGAAYYYGGSVVPYSSSYGKTGPGYYYAQPAQSTGTPGYYYANNQQQPEDGADTVFGPISFARIVRVTLLKWPSLIVSVVICLVLAFVYYKATPPTYKASSMIEINIKPSRIMNNADAVINDFNAQGTTQEIFSTRLATLKSMRVIKLVMDRVRRDYKPIQSLSDEELYDLLKNNVEFEVQKQSRLCLISVVHTSPEVAQAVANAYADTAVVFSMDENKDTAESSTAWLKSKQDEYKRDMDNALRYINEYDEQNEVGTMTTERESLGQIYQKLSLDKVEADTALAADNELLSILTSILKDPSKFSSIPGNTPRAQEISEAQKILENAISERNGLLTRYTEKHPEVEKINLDIKLFEKQYSQAVSRARDTAAANRELSAKHVNEIDARLKANFAQQQELAKKISMAEGRITQLKFDYENASKLYQAISQRMEETRILIDDSLATIRVIEHARVPTTQYQPVPRIVFSVGALIGLIIGFMTILIVEHLEDHITSSDEIRTKMNSTVLALIPRVPRTKRTQLALLSATKKFSRIAEAFAGLRGLLESPRFVNVSKTILLISTQPEEGKTISSCNLALSFAMAGKKTLLVDFDLRRPRIARIFNVHDKLTSENSLIDVLADQTSDSFDRAVIDSGFENLDLVVSAVSNSISPTNVIGSDKAEAFFDWAKQNYEHIIIDSSPFGLVSDAIRLGAFSDSVIIVCRPHKSRLTLVSQAISALRNSGSNIIGVVVNEVNFNQGNAFTSGSYTSYAAYSHYSKYGNYGGRYGYGYGSYYKRAIKDDIATKHKHREENASAVVTEEAESAKSSVPDLDGDDE